MPPVHFSHARCFSSADALRSVFLAGTHPTRPALHLPLRPRPSSLVAPAHLLPLAARRYKSGKQSDDLQALLDKESEREAQRRLPRALRWARPDRDEGINSRHVVFIDPATNRPGRPRLLALVLAEIDRTQDFVIKVGMDGTGAEALPLCKILPKKEVFAKEQARARQATEAVKTKKKRDGKTVELGWATAEGDLVHRFRKARNFLESGERVNFLIENRQRRTVVPEERAKLMLAKVHEAIKELGPKVVEVGREGVLGQKMKIVFGFKEQQGQQPEQLQQQEKQREELPQDAAE